MENSTFINSKETTLQSYYVELSGINDLEELHVRKEFLMSQIGMLEGQLSNQEVSRARVAALSYQQFLDQDGTD